jgi:hypothetical protein
MTIGVAFGELCKSLLYGGKLTDVIETVHETNYNPGKARRRD